MRISISSTLNNEQGTLDVAPPLFSINDKIDLIAFKVSKSRVAPFEEFVVEWEIVPKVEYINIEEYEFRLMSHYKLFGNDIGTNGLTRISIHTRTLLTIQTRKKKSGRNFENLGESIAMLIDHSNCSATKELASSIFDGILMDKINASLEGISQLKLKRDIEPIWHGQFIEYNLPLELVIDNFFNGDLDIKLKINFRVDHEDSGSYLDVSISSSENANFSWYEDVLSIGHTATIAKTIEKLMPVIIKFITRDAELEIVKGLYEFLNIGNYLDTHRLLEINIVPNNNFSYLNFLFCNKDENTLGVPNNELVMRNTNAIQ